MIFNVPHHDQLNEIALLLYYEAWEGILSTKHKIDDASSQDFFEQNQLEHLKKGLLRELAADEAKLAQSIEIGLKAKIAQISPYLILKEPHKRYSRNPKDVGFSEFMTLDASELIGAVHSLTDAKLSENFCRLFDQIRSRRNVFQHLGMNEMELNIDQNFEIAAISYLELWPDSPWLTRWIDTKSSRWHAAYYDYKNTSEHGDVFMEWPYVRKYLKPEIFKRMFNAKETDVCFIHADCFEQADVRLSGLEPTKDYCTAYAAGNNMLHCIACNEAFSARPIECDICDSSSFEDATMFSGRRCLRCYARLDATPVSDRLKLWVDEDPFSDDG